jgi:chemosensory pili system protein ChpA (sensor histidine kinase/response regulator)
MTKGRELFALEWVKSEILGTLDSARQSLEAYAEFGRDETRMRVCLTGLHQVHGSLVMLELPGIALLSDHLERLSQAVLDGKFENVEPACQLLMQGVLEMPVRLERIQEGHPDASANVLGLVNPIRTLLGMEPLDGPRPVQYEAGEAALDRFERIDGVGKIRRIRSAFQGVLLRLLKGEQPPLFIDTLRKVGSGLERICQDTASEILWQCFGEFVESLNLQEDAVSADSIKMLRRVDAEIRRFGQEGVEAVLAPVPEKLLLQLIELAAQGGRSSERLELLRQRVEPVDDGELIASGREALLAASHALVDELAALKDQIDLLVRAETRSHEPLAAMLPALRKLASTCSLLGFESSRVAILQQVDLIEGVTADEAVSRDVLFAVASALVQVEENFRAVSTAGIGDSRQAGIGAAEQQVLKQARSELEVIKQAVVAFVGNGFVTSHLEGVSERLHGLAAVLTVSGFSRPAALLEDCRAFLVLEISRCQADESAEQWERLDRFADCLSGIDYHLERIEDRAGGRAEDILDIVERNLVAAGYFGSGAELDARLSMAAEDSGAATTLEPESSVGLVEAQVAEAHLAEAHATDAQAAQAQVPAEPSAESSWHESPALELVNDPVVEFTDQPSAANPQPQQDSQADVFSGSPADNLAADQTEDVSVVVAVVEPSAFTEFPEDLAADPTTAADLQPPTIELADLLSEPFEGPVAAEHSVGDLVEYAAKPEADPVVELAVEPAVGPAVEFCGTKPAETPAAYRPNDSVLVQDPAASQSPEPAATAPEPARREWINDELTAAFDLESLDVHDKDYPTGIAPQAEDIHHAEESAQATPVATASGAEGLFEFNLSDSRFDLLEPAVNAAAAEQSDDDEIRGIFVEEAAEVLEALARHLRVWRENPSAVDAVREARRCFHTLKGSGRVAGAVQIGELSWAIENMLNRLLDGTIAASGEFVDISEEASRLMPELVHAFAAHAAAPRELISSLIDSADVLASGGSISGALDEESEEPAGAVASDDVQLFVQELQENLTLLRNKTGRRRVQIDEELLMALHTTTGSAGLVGETKIARLSEMLYDIARSTRAEVLRGPNVEVDVARLFQESVDGVELLATELLSTPEGDHAVVQGSLDGLIERAEEILGRVDESPSEEGLLELPELDVILNARESFDAWIEGRADRHFIDTLILSLQAVMGATFRPQITDVAKALLAALRSLEDEPSLGQVHRAALVDGCERILHVVDAIASDRILPRVDDVVTRLSDLASGVATGNEVPSAPIAEGEPIESTSPGAVAAQAPVTELAAPVMAPSAAQIDARTEAILQREAENMDPDLGEVFLEESEETLESLEGFVQSFCLETDNLLHLEHILRGLHTLKGSARLAGLALFGDRVHHFESMLASLQLGAATVDVSTRGTVQSRFDEILKLWQLASDAFRQRNDRQLATDGTQVADAVVSPRTRQPGNAEVVSAGEARVAEAPSIPSLAEPAADMVRVRATLLETLVNLAGESSILRARVEQGISDFTSALDEMETTIDRVSEQLRRLEIETDTQVHFGGDRPDRRPTQFDPLEMDRYSQLQQLTRALSESASDMRDLKDTLLLRSREAETILLQQARVNTELQEGLMRTRMVPFNRLTPRLNRIVRQVAAELGKDVEFRVFNAEGELDRNLLERMVAPLEHMLRNAVDHGIETNMVRRSFGKPVPGRIDLRLSREGGDIVIEIGDDGMGIDVESVRSKAMERGLMRPDAMLSDEEVLEFVLAPGFSTAKSVTQISGRGVGLDVVNSEVKQLGGSVSIFSTASKGTRFVVRLPFTVSVNRALMVTVGDDQYAIPLNTIEGIVLVDAQTLKAIYASEDKLFEYAGLAYRVRYLGRYLGRGEPQISQRGGIPLVLVRAGDQSVAIAVDGVQGSREIVVKSLGPQFAGVGGISGATILGDGSVVIILDLVALIRSQGRDVLAAVTRDGTSALRPRCVMVVDDSVTVRKVTTRLLERQGMDVVVAKDGVEAMSLLGERTPDVMLLDIEMPRMDGFEVARQVRHDVRIADLPIIMISSRTGQKHQEHAQSLKINRFLGKPFQESELLAAIEALAERR